MFPFDYYVWIFLCVHVKRRRPLLIPLWEYLHNYSKKIEERRRIKNYFKICSYKKYFFSKTQKIANFTFVIYIFEIGHRYFESITFLMWFSFLNTAIHFYGSLYYIMYVKLSILVSILIIFCCFYYVITLPVLQAIRNSSQCEQSVNGNICGTSIKKYYYIFFDRYRTLTAFQRMVSSLTTLRGT